MSDREQDAGGPDAVVSAPLSVAEVREYDRRAMAELGLPGAVLMENAGRAAAEVILARCFGAGGERRAVILAGPGNNGGDGYVIARHLANAGVAVELASTATRASLRGDAALFRGVCDRMGLQVRELVTAHQLQREQGRWARAHVLVDALLGTGFHGELRPHLAAVLAAVNGGEAPGSPEGGRRRKVAIDVPSGLDADTGVAAPGAFRADLTVTFVAPKLGFALADGPAHLGELFVRGIGAPGDLLSR